MSILKVEGLCKKYQKFQLNNVFFSLEKGYIMGFIGANGAGKTTTIKSILNLTKIDSGKITILGQDFLENEISIKKEIGFTFGEADYYPKHKLRVITSVVKRFYQEWDDNVYNQYMKRFELDDEKKICELSHGMRVKYSLVLALSHGAKLFILDEPTSGLDPIARDNLLELFQEIIEDGEKSIIFSTHITSDLEKCADYITYINNGEIIESSEKDDLINSYRVIKGTSEHLKILEKSLISYKTNSFGFSGLIKSENLKDIEGLHISAPTLEDIMIYYSKRSQQNEKLAI